MKKIITLSLMVILILIGVLGATNLNAATLTNCTIYLAGDSTVQTYNASYAPQAGWGQFFSKYFSSSVTVVNKAIGGRSSKSFVEEGRLDEILNVIKPGDYLFVQFGHNDATISNPDRYAAPYTTYKEYLKKYVDGARAHGATPVLVTPVARLHYSNNTFINDFPDYCTAMKQVASENNVLIIDLMTRSLNYYASKGYDAVYPMYMVSSNGTDYTHFTEYGANIIAGLVYQGVQQLSIPTTNQNIPQAGVEYNLINRNSGKLLEVQNGSADNGANIVQWPSNGYSCQRWTFEDAGNGYYKIKNVNSQKYLEVMYALTDNGADISQWDNTGHACQEWKLQATDSGYYILVNRNSSKALDVFEWSTADGAEVLQWDNLGGANQQWLISPY